MIRELKKRANRLGTILTAIHESIHIPMTQQIDNVLSWEGSSSRIIVHTNEKLPQQFGIRTVGLGKTPLLVRDMLASYIVQIPGNEIFAICLPDVKITAEVAKVVDHADDQRMERAWAAHVSPLIFIASAPVLPHIFRDTPPSMIFSDPEWPVWLHNWLSRFMLQHRYFDASRFEFVKRADKDIDINFDIFSPDPKPPVEPPKVIEAALPEIPVKKKPGRKKADASSGS